MSETVFPAAFQRLVVRDGDLGVSLPGNQAMRRAVGWVLQSEHSLTAGSASIQWGWCIDRLPEARRLPIYVRRRIALMNRTTRPNRVTLIAAVLLAPLAALPRRRHAGRSRPNTACADGRSTKRSCAPVRSTSHLQRRWIQFPRRGRRSER